jgi:uncharacterized protein
MAEWSDPRVTQNQAGVTINGEAMGSVSVDQGLRSHMLKVYNYMASGVLLTGIVALLLQDSALAQSIASGGPLFWVVLFAPIGLGMAMGVGYNRFSQTTLQTMFWGYATLMGLWFSVILMRFTGASVAQTFFVTSVAFLSLSLYGYTTKKDLTGWGSFLIMGAVGILLAIVVNMFLKSPTMHYAISAIGVLVFAGLTAYDTQNIKSQYLNNVGHESLGKLAVMGAFYLYLDFVNMFQFLLSFLGSRD